MLGRVLVKAQLCGLAQSCRIASRRCAAKTSGSREKSPAGLPRRERFASSGWPAGHGFAIEREFLPRRPLRAAARTGARLFVLEREMHALGDRDE